MCTYLRCAPGVPQPHRGSGIKQFRHRPSLRSVSHVITTPVEERYVNDDATGSYTCSHRQVRNAW